VRNKKSSNVLLKQINQVIYNNNVDKEILKLKYQEKQMSNTSDTAHFYRYRNIVDDETDEVICCVTAAVIRRGEEYSVGFAFCSTNDIHKFNKSLGRSIASGRAAKYGITVYPDEISNAKGVFEAAYEVMFNIFETRPSWIPQCIWNMSRDSHDNETTFESNHAHKSDCSV
jgi:glutamate dehydrogenase/leucine dehydrogenase